MERFVHRQNVEHYLQPLTTTTDEGERQRIMKLLAEERQKQMDAAPPVSLVRRSTIRKSLAPDHEREVGQYCRRAATTPHSLSQALPAAIRYLPDTQLRPSPIGLHAPLQHSASAAQAEPSALQATERGSVDAVARPC
jgi:hypothetical protein